MMSSVSILSNYGKCSMVLNTFLSLFSNGMLVIRAGIGKIFFRIANREDPDQTASSEAILIWVWAICAGFLADN